MRSVGRSWWGWVWRLALAVTLAACDAGQPPLDRPRGLALATTGSLYVVDAASFQALRLSATGQVEQRFSLGVRSGGQSAGVWDMALDPSGNIYFCRLLHDEEHTFHDGIVVYTSGGKFLREIGGQDYGRDQSGSPNLPYGLDVDNAGRVYVADYGTNRLRVFDAQGQLLGSFLGAGDEGSLWVGLSDVVVDNQRSLLYLVDQDGQQIVQFVLGFEATGAPTLTLLRVIGAYGQRPGELAFPQFAVVDPPTGYLYVGDMANRRIQVFNAAGAYVLTIDAPPAKDWQVMGLAVGPDGVLYAADTLNDVIWVFSLAGKFLRRIEAHR